MASTNRPLVEVVFEVEMVIVPEDAGVTARVPPSVLVMTPSVRFTVPPLELIVMLLSFPPFVTGPKTCPFVCPLLPSKARVLPPTTLLEA